MQIHARFIDDFKTERKDIAPPLPAYLRLVPVLFYVSIVATILLNALFLTQWRQASQAKDASLKQNRDLEAQLEAVKKERQQLEAEAKKATDVASWLDGSRPLQPLIVDIARSMEKDTSIVEMHLERAPENASQIRLGLRLQTANTRQLDQTLQTIANARFRTFSPQQSMDRGEVDYKATLLWQDSSRGQPEPASVQ
jgi:cell division protein FtsB